MKQLFVLTPESAEVADEETWDVIGKIPGFVTHCALAIDMLLGRKDWVELDSEFMLSRSEPRMQIPCRLMIQGAIGFVRLHEYGHLLMRHLSRQHDRQFEFEADSFAMAVIGRKDVSSA